MLDRRKLFANESPLRVDFSIAQSRPVVGLALTNLIVYLVRILSPVSALRDATVAVEFFVAFRCARVVRTEACVALVALART